MEKNNSLMAYSYAGVALMLLGLFLPFIKVPFFGGFSILLDFGKLGGISGFMYVLSILAIGVVAYSAYISFKKKKSYKLACFAGAGYFVILLISYFVIYVKLEGFASMGFGLFMFLLGAAAYFMANKEYQKIEK